MGSYVWVWQAYTPLGALQAMALILGPIARAQFSFLN
jgi:hypothetical protein